MSRLQVHFQTYENLDGSKGDLVQRVGSGSIIKRFDKTPIPQLPTDVVCPHFLELKWAYGCPYRCAWCYLQGTLRMLPTKTRPIVKDYKKIERHVLAFFQATEDGTESRSKNYPMEILNSGELSDSLMWERNGNPFSHFVHDLFSTQKKHKVLLLSKSNAIDNIIKLDTSLIIPSFTLNAHSVSNRWEAGAPKPTFRIKAAQTLQRMGYPIRIRIDPLVPIKNWQYEYRNLIDELFASFTPERITFGSLRGLQSTINNSRDRSWVPYLEERSNWGLKIASAQRYEMYKHLIGYLRSEYHFNKIALCKETIELWNLLALDYTSCNCNCVE